MDLDVLEDQHQLSDQSTPSSIHPSTTTHTPHSNHTGAGSGDGRSDVDLVKKQKSCAPCRIRRVKCERKPGQHDCIKCVEKGLNCSAMPQRKRVNRSGKRIEQARGAFGSAQQDDTTHSHDQFDQLEVVTGSSWLESEQTVGRRLGTQEIQAAVTNSLLDLYLAQDTGVGRLLVTDTALAFDFHRANRRVHELKPSAQVLCAVIMAIGARCSDHPALIGAGAPRIAELGTAARAGVDLRPFGRRREDACATLFDRALQLADQHGTLRDPSLESLASLVLIEGLVDTTDVTHSEARPFVNAYTSHTKVLLEQGGIKLGPTTKLKPGVANTVLGWTAYLRDAMTSANQGRSPAFSEDDLYLLTDGGKEIPLPLRLLLENNEPSLEREVDVVHSFWQLFQSIMHAIANLAREVSSHLTGPRARATERMDEAFAERFLDEATYLFNALPELNRRELLAKVAMPELYLQADIATLVRTISFSSCTLSWMLNRIVGQRLAGRHPETTSSLADRGLGGGVVLNSRGEMMNPWPPMPGPSNDEAYWRRLFMLRRRVYTQSFRASRRVASIIGATIEQGYSLSSAWLDPRFVQVLFSRLAFWASSIVNMPTIEQGGPHPDFAFIDKLQDLDWIKKGCFSVGWMSLSMAGSADWVKQEIAKTEQAQAEHWSRKTQVPVSTSQQSHEVDLESFLSSLSAEQLAHAGVLLEQPPPGGLAVSSNMPPGSVSSWPPSRTSDGSAGTSNPASPPSGQGSSPSSGTGASPPSSGVAGASNLLSPRAFTDAEVQALLEQYVVPPPTSPAAPLLGMPVQGPAQPPLPSFGMAAGAALPTAGSWQAFAQPTPPGPPGMGVAAFEPGGAKAGQGPSLGGGQPSTAKAPLQGDYVGGVDWNELLGMDAGGGGFEGAWAMLGGEGDPFAGLQGDPVFGPVGAGAGQPF